MWTVPSVESTPRTAVSNDTAELQPAGPAASYRLTAWSSPGEHDTGDAHGRSQRRVSGPGYLIPTTDVQRGRRLESLIRSGGMAGSGRHQRVRLRNGSGVFREGAVRVRRARPLESRARSVRSATALSRALRSVAETVHVRLWICPGERPVESPGNDFLRPCGAL